MTIVFATNNQNKLTEIRQLLGDEFEVLSLADIDLEGDIPEDHETLEENAIQKAEFIYKKCELPCFADDTGLEIDALDGRPGVYSARYAGEACRAEDNMAKVLGEMEGEDKRSAAFRTVIALINNGEVFTFEGKIEGDITTEKKGLYGFGYDPIFQPKGRQVTFAEMWIEQKNELSHRGRAVKKLVEFLKENKG